MRQQPEARFITLCLREAELIEVTDLSAAADSVQDWKSVTNLATRHRVAAYVLRAADAASIRLPDVAREAMRAEVLACQAQVMLLDAELHRVAEALASAQIGVIVLKGPVLARTLYRQDGLRPYGDLDLTVQESDEAAAAAILGRCGFTELPYEAGVAQRAHAGHLEHGLTFHRLFAGADDRALIELHTDPLQLGFRPTCEAERWARAAPAPGIP